MFSKLKKLFAAKKRRPRSIVLRKEGVHFNLQEIYDRINAQYFEGKVDLQITWFGPKKSRYQRRVVLGCYHHTKKLVKINRILDQPDIPDYYISFIVYHEILHHVAPPVIQRFRRRKIHHRQFKDLEKKFQDYALVKDFKEKTKTRWFVD